MVLHSEAGEIEWTDENDLKQRVIYTTHPPCNTQRFEVYSSFGLRCKAVGPFSFWKVKPASYYMLQVTWLHLCAPPSMLYGPVLPGPPLVLQESHGLTPRWSCNLPPLCSCLFYGLFRIPNSRPNSAARLGCEYSPYWRNQWGGPIGCWSHDDCVWNRHFQ